MKLVSGAGGGGAGGMVVGTVWELIAARRMGFRPQFESSLHFCVGLMLFASSILFMLPNCMAAERERDWLRELRNADVAAIVVRTKEGDRRIDDAKGIRTLADLAADAEIDHSSHDGNWDDFQLRIVIRGKEVRVYNAGFSERFPDDLRLTFRAKYALQQLIVPDARVPLKQCGLIK
jgi:hypothetical protein